MRHAYRLLLGVLPCVCLSYAQEPAKDAKAGAKTIAGGCHCGAVRYEVKGKIAGQSYCDCRGCQRASGTLKTPFVTVLQSSFKLTGKVTSYRSTSGVKCDANGTWHFCPKCGGHLYWRPNRGDKLDIFAGTLDDTKLFTVKDE
jgi:hypothetical protein